MPNFCLSLHFETDSRIVLVFKPLKTINSEVQNFQVKNVYVTSLLSIFSIFQTCLQLSHLVTSSDSVSQRQGKSVKYHCLC